MKNCDHCSYFTDNLYGLEVEIEKDNKLKIELCGFCFILFQDARHEVERRSYFLQCFFEKVKKNQNQNQKK